MAGAYKSVGWNRQKRLYDFVLGSSIIAFVGVFVATTLLTNSAVTAETIILRSTAVSALFLLHVILCIGPLARLDNRFLPLLYNRRHLGVAMFVLAAIHAALALVQFHAFGDINPLVSIFTAYKMDYNPFAPYGRMAHFPFEVFGLASLVILFFMAATSHDFWLRILGASFWKTLHLLVYIAYGSLLVHVAFGAMQYERSPVYVTLLTVGFAIVMGLHLMAQKKERAVDRHTASPESEGFVEACHVGSLRDGFGKSVTIAGERRAVFRSGDRVFALSGVCRHQGGPVGEGRILDGCITCPWHGWQYEPDTGTSPPPFHEVIETYPVRVENGTVYVNPEPNPLESKASGALINGDA